MSLLLTLLKVNRSLRHWVLRNGPLGQKLDKIYIYLSSKTRHSQIAWVRCDFAHFRWNLRELLKYHHLLENIIYCAELDVYEEKEESEKKTYNIKSILEIFPKLKGTGFLELNQVRVGPVRRIFPKEFDVLAKTTLRIKVGDLIDELNNFFEIVTKNCPSFQIRNAENFMSSLARSKAKYLEMESWAEESEEILNWILENGFPSQKAESLCYLKNLNLNRFQIQRVISLFSAEIKLETSSVTHAEIVDFFYENQSQKEESLYSDLFTKVDLFKKMINSNVYIFFFLMLKSPRFTNCTLDILIRKVSLNSLNNRSRIPIWLDS
ncbi:unnamed protein product, partial [Mesorhabditis belari]